VTDEGCFDGSGIQVHGLQNRRLLRNYCSDQQLPRTACSAGKALFHLRRREHCL